VNSVCKILRSNQCVQLIVFFAAIREILKREIYRRDKQSFCSLKTKAALACCGVRGSRFQIRSIRFANAG
jgi:hypothetical protein